MLINHVMGWGSAVLFCLLGANAFADPPTVAADAPTVAADAAAGFECIENEDAITLQYRGKPVLRYNKSIQEPPAGIDPVYRRSGYIHPIWTPSGRIVTGDFAADHPHQHGLFLAFVNTTFDGQAVDFWNQRAGTGRVEHERVLSVDQPAQGGSGGNAARFVVTQLHQALSEGEQPRTVLRETWTITAREANTDHAEQTNRADQADIAARFVVDLESELKCVAASPLQVNEYHYGGLAIRGALDLFRPRAGRAFQDWVAASADNPDLSPPGIDIMGHAFLTSAGKQRHDGNHTVANWVDMSGVIEDQPAGIAILSHAGNFRAPQPIRLNSAKPYFCFAPMITGGFELVPGQTLRSRYRLVVHDGPADAKAIDGEFADYVRDE